MALFDGMVRRSGRLRRSRRVVVLRALLLVGLSGVVEAISGCTAIPLKRLAPNTAELPPACGQPMIYDGLKGLYLPPLAGGMRPLQFMAPGPGTSYSSNQRREFSVRERNNAQIVHMVGTVSEYRQAIEASMKVHLPDEMMKGRPGKVVKALENSLIQRTVEEDVRGAMALDSTLTMQSPNVVAAMADLKQHAAPAKVGHADMKAFADAFVSLTQKPSPKALVDGAQSMAAVDPKTAAFSYYFVQYYKGNFFDRMGVNYKLPPISATVEDSEITDAETVLLEYLLDLISPVPVLKYNDPNAKTTVYYPGGTKDEPTAAVANLAPVIEIKGDGCGVTAQNAWVLKDLTKGAGDEAGTVSGLVANTAGGISLGLGVLGKISIGDNQTLSVLVKTAAARVAMRLTLAASYAALKDLNFQVAEP